LKHETEEIVHLNMTMVHRITKRNSNI